MTIHTKSMVNPQALTKRSSTTWNSHTMNFHFYRQSLLLFSVHFSFIFCFRLKMKIYCWWLIIIIFECLRSELNISSLNKLIIVEWRAWSSRASYFICKLALKLMILAEYFLDCTQDNKYRRGLFYVHCGIFYFESEF